MYGSPPSKRQTLCPAARSSMTRLRTTTISENPTPPKRLAGPGRGNEPSVTGAPSDHFPTAGAHQEVQDHAEHREQDNDDHPQELRAAVRAALENGDDRDDVEDRDEEPEQGMKEHRILLTASPR